MTEKKCDKLPEKREFVSEVRGRARERSSGDILFNLRNAFS